MTNFKNKQKKLEISVRINHSLVKEVKTFEIFVIIFHVVKIN